MARSSYRPTPRTTRWLRSRVRQMEVCRLQGRSQRGVRATDFHLPHLPSQGSVTLTRDRRHLLVTNVASNDVSVFAVNGGMLELTKTVPVGAAPRSIAEHDGLVFVLATGDATIPGFRLVEGDLVPVDGAM